MTEIHSNKNDFFNYVYNMLGRLRNHMHILINKVVMLFQETHGYTAENRKNRSKDNLRNARCTKY